ncbi:hypothetical protein [Microbaculum marinisediminis]|uniref:Uncharacterized protein n=1 Tax=Microbaculum marinisediminis TaxID=2931392 RepID=A0AAW5QXP1_9HYPH|nr:hypothetical protein [Microbaculum sp. A6E488]MCT8972692.1 hypothetical protein [Microbaculum sp. A6E488]
MKSFAVVFIFTQVITSPELGLVFVLWALAVWYLAAAAGQIAEDRRASRALKARMAGSRVAGRAAGATAGPGGGLSDDGR